MSKYAKGMTKALQEKDEEIASLKSKLAHKALENADLNLRNREIVLKLEAKDEVLKMARNTLLSLRTVIILGHKNPEVIDWESAERECNTSFSQIDALVEKVD